MRNTTHCFLSISYRSKMTYPRMGLSIFTHATNTCYCNSSCNPEDKKSSMTQALEYPFSSPISLKWLFCINILEDCQKHTMYTYYAGFFDIPIVQRSLLPAWGKIISYLGVQDTLYPSKVKLKRT